MPRQVSQYMVEQKQMGKMYEGMQLNYQEVGGTRVGRLALQDGKNVWFGVVEVHVEYEH
jgi:hypothetical protein